MLPSILEQCEAWRPRVRTARPSRPGVLLRIAVPFHLGLRNLGRELRKVAQAWAPLMARVWNKGEQAEGWLDVQVAFSSAGPSLAELCRRLQ